MTSTDYYYFKNVHNSRFMSDRSSGNHHHFCSESLCTYFLITVILSFKTGASASFFLLRFGSTVIGTVNQSNLNITLFHAMEMVLYFLLATLQGNNTNSHRCYSLFGRHVDCKSDLPAIVRLAQLSDWELEYVAIFSLAPWHGCNTLHNQFMK